MICKVTISAKCNLCSISLTFDRLTLNDLFLCFCFWFDDRFSGSSAYYNSCPVSTASHPWLQSTSRCKTRYWSCLLLRLLHKLSMLHYIIWRHCWIGQAFLIMLFRKANIIIIMLNTFTFQPAVYTHCGPICLCSLWCRQMPPACMDCMHGLCITLILIQ